MPKFTIHMSQYVEQVATMEIEAATEQEARDKAISDAPRADWIEGCYAEKAEIREVISESGVKVYPIGEEA